MHIKWTNVAYCGNLLAQHNTKNVSLLCKFYPKVKQTENILQEKFLIKRENKYRNT